MEKMRMARMTKLNKVMFINQNIICSRISYEVIKWTDSKNV